jgi:diguanylate cyclase (GGDEF)-like protein/PAS domain S-box-containing protein
MFGYTSEEMEPLNMHELYANSDDRSMLLNRLNKNQTVKDFETNLLRKDGTIINAVINSDYIILNNERVLLNSIQDITRYLESQKKLQLAEERYYTIFSNVPVGITVTDFTGKIFASNKAIENLLGYNTEEFNKLTAPDFYLEKNDRMLLLDKTKENPSTRDFESNFIRRDGKVVPVLINTDIINFNEQNEMMLNSIRDISNIKNVENALIHERDFINAILDATTSIIIVLDMEGKITRINKAFERIFEYSYEEIKNKSFADELTTEAITVNQQIQSINAKDFPNTYEDLWVTKSGETRLISWSVTPLADQSDHSRHIITGIDITEKRQVEDDLYEANQKLESQVEELKEKTNEINLLGDLGGFLQGCQSDEEACAISAQYMSKICPYSNGSIYLINPSRDLAEIHECWGNYCNAKKTFEPLSCWAIRRGRIHFVDKEHPGLLCSHITNLKDSKDGQSICLPMSANGEIIGILHMNKIITTEFGPNNTTKFSEHKIKLLTAAAETLALALSNIRLQEKMRQQSIRDILTGLYNRRYMEESLTRELHRAQREQYSIGILMFDIDHFKNFNDTYGHEGGDILLHELGELMLNSTRKEDIVCRYGGEEFVTVFPKTTLEIAKKRAEELREKVKQMQVYHLDNPLRKCTISIGVAVYPEHGTSSEEIVRNADAALYRAKKEGRDRVVIAETGNQKDAF